MTLRQWHGKTRRFWDSHLRRGYVAEQHARRRGECKRCGRCCSLGVRCPFLAILPDGMKGCSIYDKRPLQCRTFPITSSDIEEAGCTGYCFE